MTPGRLDRLVVVTPHFIPWRWCPRDPDLTRGWAALTESRHPPRLAREHPHNTQSTPRLPISTSLLYQSFPVLCILICIFPQRISGTWNRDEYCHCNYCKCSGFWENKWTHIDMYVFCSCYKSWNYTPLRLSCDFAHDLLQKSIGFVFII